MVAERLFEATELVALFPQGGRKVPEVDDESLRELIVGEYRVVYRLEGEVAVLLTIFRSSRLFPFERVEGDVLYISVGEPRPAVTIDLGESILARYDEKEREVVGITILNVGRRLLEGLSVKDVA